MSSCKLLSILMVSSGSITVRGVDERCGILELDLLSKSARPSFITSEYFAPKIMSLSVRAGSLICLLSGQPSGRQSQDSVAEYPQVWLFYLVLLAENDSCSLKSVQAKNLQRGFYKTLNRLLLLSPSG